MSNIKYSVSALTGIPHKVNGYNDNILYCGGASTSWYKSMQIEHPGRVFPTLYDAINALPAGDGTNTFGYNNSVIFVGPELPEVTSTTLPVVPKTKSGVTIMFGPDAFLYTTADLGANVALLTLEGNYSRVVGGRFFTTQASQAGSAIIVGGASASGKGAGLYCRLEGVTIQGPENSAYTDFAKGIQIRDGKYTYVGPMENGIPTRVYGSAGTTAGISIEAGIANSTGVYLKDVFVKFLSGGASTKPLVVASSQNYGVIDGGCYMTDSGATAIEIAGDAWTLIGGGLAGNTDTVGASAQIDITGTGMTIGAFYVKDIDANTAPTLFDQTNI